MKQPVQQRIFHLLAQILEYPRTYPLDAVRECEALVSLSNAEAAAYLRQFQDFVAGMSPERLQEIYTITFDLDAAYHPYVGHHLFGESYKRSAFMLELKKRYQPYGLEVGSELPDHLAVLLHYLSRCREAEEVEEIIREALLPALERMIKKEVEKDIKAARQAGLLHPPDWNKDTASAPEGEQQTPPEAREPEGYQIVLEALRLILQSLFPANNPQPAPQTAMA